MTVLLKNNSDLLLEQVLEYYGWFDCSQQQYLTSDPNNKFSLGFVLFLDVFCDVFVLTQKPNHINYYSTKNRVFRNMFDFIVS